MVRGNTAKRKSTFFLNEDLLAEIKEMVPIRGLRSQSALVEVALREYIARVRQENLRRQYLEASKDPQFISDIDEIEKTFERADAETSR